jgi:YVTN family beta-propeller protein
MNSGVDPDWPAPLDDTITDHDEIRRTGFGGPWWWVVIGGLALLAGLVAVLGGGVFDGNDTDTAGPVGENGTDRSDRAGGETGEPGDDPGDESDRAEGSPGLPLPDDEPFPTEPPTGRDPGEFRPDSIDVGAGAVWVSDIGCGVVVRINPETERVEGSIDIGGAASGVAVSNGLVWVGNRTVGRVVGIEPDNIRVGASVELPGYALGLAAGDGSVWAVDPWGEAVHRIDGSTGTLVDSIEVGENPHYVVADGGVAWVVNNGDGTVSRIDTTGNEVTATVPVGEGPLHVVEGAGSAWVTNSLDGTVSRLRVATGEVEVTVAVGPFPHALAFASDEVWVGTESGQLWRIDPADDGAEQVPAADFDSIDMAVDGTDIWVADSDNGSVVRVDTTTAEVTARIDLADFGSCQDFRLNAVRPPFAQQVRVPAGQGGSTQDPKLMPISSSLRILSAGGGTIPRSAPKS